MSDTFFDRWAIIDWSAASRPTTGPNSIWVANSARDGHTVELLNPATRAAAFDSVAALLDDWSAIGARGLIGIDCSLGLPVGAGALLTTEGSSGAAGDTEWQRVWEAVDEVVDDDLGAPNANNRFAAAAELNRRSGPSAGPFWGHPPRLDLPGLGARKPELLAATPAGDPVDEYRRAERLLRELGHAVQSTWKIAYQASVGGQFLMVVGWLRRLQRRYPNVRLWPFETGFDTSPEPGDVWVGEIWPGEFELGGHHPVRDADQVTTALHTVMSADHSGTLGSWFASPSGDHRAVALAAEGWPWSPALAGKIRRAKASGA